MIITPKTNIKLLKCPLILTNKNQITFENEEKQFEYFNNLPFVEVKDNSYIRKDSVIRFPAHIDEILEFNYVMYQNENYSNKWFYAFITNMSYENNNLTLISIATDVWQTWQFDLNFKESFIEREMINIQDDIIGANLLPEGLELGELTVHGTAEFDELETVNIVAYSGETIPLTINGAIVGNLIQGGYTVNGIPSSIVFLIVENEWYNILMNNLQKENFSDYILTCFTVPKLAVQDFMISENIIDGMQYNVYALTNPNNYLQSILTKTLNSVPEDFEGFIPKNQKLKTYPYTFLAFNPTGGSSKIYRYENFENNTPIFNIISEVNPNPTVYFIPQNYRGSKGNSMSDIANLNGFPTLSYRNDYYNSWIAQNEGIINLQAEREQYNYEVSQIQTGLNMGGSIVSALSGNPTSAGGMITGALSLAQADVNHDFFIKMQMAQKEKQKLIPDKVNLAGSNSTLLGYNLLDKNIFTSYTIKKQFAERIDRFFDMYGYQTNTLKIPNLNNRPNWNYVKTLSCNIIADIPQEHLIQIKNFFDNGITLWHNPETFLDYNINNR